jgi:hypothetical protein
MIVDIPDHLVETLRLTLAASRTLPAASGEFNLIAHYAMKAGTLAGVLRMLLELIPAEDDDDLRLYAEEGCGSDAVLDRHIP